ncbi:META and DUF4377 domain-containing protein [Stenotrophomonas sp. MMGLT7]|uniref:META and DUF4377 domain-containing protein n=1 Tax=Stenotrophomonas sp. MMGLT7 TaxID=2901227 RepID=UPI001E4FFDA9|nr:META and DUF4377 domain-containing protein [Stenotrophomonas sp. MMGLT7]MCD7099910.1 META and DUF4377 domain-containing protein [Stenotrophomonas sp. MMGLT7]
MNKLLVLLPLALALAACGREPATPAGELPDAQAPQPTTAKAAAPDPQLLGRYHWQLDQATDAGGQRVQALFVDPQRPLQLDFGDGRVAVSNTCNRMSGGYALDGSRLRVERLVSTEMACEPPLMALDQAVAQRLQAPLELATETAGDAPTLTLTAADGTVLAFHGVATAATRYGGEGQTVFLEVAAQSPPCQQPLVSGKPCLSVREVHYDEHGLRSGEPGPWQNFHETIEGYRHEPGVRNVLRVKRYAVKDPPADGAAQAYVLDMVVEAENTAR